MAQALSFQRAIFKPATIVEKKNFPEPKVGTTTVQKEAYIPFEYRETTLAGEKVKVKVTPANLVREILNHNAHNQFTEILLVGSSGSGKTTARQDILHGLHEEHNYAIHFYQKDEIQKLDKIIKELPKGVDCILAFDDVSFTFNKMTPQEIGEILHKLTFIRHTVKARVVLLLSIHYSFGILKALRQAAFRIVTSATDEETENYAKIFGGHNRRKIREFVKQYRSMVLYNKFTLRMGNNQPKEFRHDDPFRLALVSSLGKLHYMVYHKLNCGVCNTPADKNPGQVENRNEDLTDDQANFFISMFKSYPERFLKMINLYTFVKTGAPILERKDRQIWNAVSEFHELNDIDMKKVAKILKEAKKVEPVDRDAFIKDKLTNITRDILERRKAKKIDAKLLETSTDDPTMEINEPEEEEEEEKEKDGSAAADMMDSDDDTDFDMSKQDLGINELFGRVG